MARLRVVSNRMARWRAAGVRRIEGLDDDSLESATLLLSMWGAHDGEPTSPGFTPGSTGLAGKRT
jgi:hypothetical protein